MNKKGISPLIATVLIIGFVIVLAALVMQWGGDLFKNVQDETSKTSDFKITCSSKLTGLEVSIKDGKVVVDNKNDQDIAGFKVRSYKVDGTVNSDDKDEELLAYEINPDLGVGLNGVSEVGIFPKVDVQGEVKTCENEWKASVPAA